MPNAQAGPSRRLYVILIVLVLAITEGLAHVALRVLGAATGVDIRSGKRILEEQSARIRLLLDPAVGQREVLDATLGWRYRAGYRKGSDAVTVQGLRGDRTYEPLPSPGVFRIATFGDSFVYGNEVGNADAWTALLEHRSANVEVLNFGVGGYGVDQAYLRYLEDGSQLNPHVVVIGFFTDDLRRLVNVFRPFVDSREAPLAKPRFVLAQNELSLLPNPLPTLTAYRELLKQPRSVARLGQHDHWYQSAVYESALYDWSAIVRLSAIVWNRTRNRYLHDDRLFDGDTLREQSEAFRLQLAVFDRFVSAVRERGAEPVVVLFPDRPSVERLRAKGPVAYAPLARHLATRQVPVVDLAEAFAAANAETPVEQWFMPGGHYSRQGNEIVAEFLGARLQQYRQLIAGAAAPARRRVNDSSD